MCICGIRSTTRNLRFTFGTVWTIHVRSKYSWTIDVHLPFKPLRTSLVFIVLSTACLQYVFPLQEILPALLQESRWNSGICSGVSPDQSCYATELFTTLCAGYSPRKCRVSQNCRFFPVLDSSSRREFPANFALPYAGIFRRKKLPKGFWPGLELLSSWSWTHSCTNAPPIHLKLEKQISMHTIFWKMVPNLLPFLIFFHPFLLPL